MAYVHGAASPRVIPQASSLKAGCYARRSVLRQLIDAIQQANLYRAEREIAAYLGGPGAKFTDESEREIERRFLSQP